MDPSNARGTGTQLRVLQFGTGRFLRGFVDAFIDEAERDRTTAGRSPRLRVTVVETTGSGMAGRLAAQHHAYTLHIRGIARGTTVDTSRTIRVIDRSVDASADLDSLIDSALDPAVSMVVSNTTEAGYAPGGYPRLLATILGARAREGMPGLVILPCELIERNGDRLRDLVVDELGALGHAGPTVDRVRHANTWMTTLVDRIVTASAAGAVDRADVLDVVAEPFASWVIEGPDGVPVLEHPSLTRTDRIEPFALRKVRILNGAHSALVWKTRGTDLRFVREAVEDPDIHDWLEGLMREEIVPALADRIVEGESFVASVLERFRNPFLDHRLSDIAVNHGQKVALRLLPSYHDYVRRFGRPPRRLGALLVSEGVTS